MGAKDVSVVGESIVNRLIEFGIIRVTQGFSVNRYHFSSAEAAKLLHPAKKTGLELLWVNSCEHTTNGVM